MVESEKKVESTRIPKSVPFILVLSLLERVSSIGSSSILLLYLYTKLHFDQSTSTALFHTNEFLAYFFPIIGAIIAESYYGIFKTLIAGSVMFFLGVGIVAISAIEFLELPVIPLTIIGLFMAVFGCGCLRGNITAFGGNQYRMPEETKSLQLFFSLQIIFIKIGALTSRIFSPVMRQDIKCFGADDCYPFAFGFTSITSLLAFLTIIGGKPFYVHRPITENVFKKVCGCIFYSLKEKILKRSKLERNHWLDYGDTEYEAKLIEDTKQVIRVLKLFIPIPIYWAVYMQQSSRWIFQATRMDGDLGFYQLKPDQMIALNPIFCIILMPFCSWIIYPLLSKIRLGGLLARMVIGGFWCFAAFILAIFVELKIQHSYISMLWLAPQFVFIAMSENFFFVSLLNFAYAEAPASMKSVMTACVFTTIAIGNMFVTLISGAKVFTSQVNEFIFFLVILFAAIILFSSLAVKYRKAQKSVSKTTVI